METYKLIVPKDRLPKDGIVYAFRTSEAIGRFLYERCTNTMIRVGISRSTYYTNPKGDDSVDHFIKVLYHGEAVSDIEVVGKHKDDWKIIASTQLWMDNGNVTDDTLIADVALKQGVLPEELERAFEEPPYHVTVQLADDIYAIVTICMHESGEGREIGFWVRHKDGTNYPIGENCELLKAGRNPDLYMEAAKEICPTLTETIAWAITLLCDEAYDIYFRMREPNLIDMEETKNHDDC